MSASTLEQSQVRHVGNMYNEYKYPMGQKPVV